MEKNYFTVDIDKILVRCRILFFSHLPRLGNI